jgi:hypothetical protein
MPLCFVHHPNLPSRALGHPAGDLSSRLRLPAILLKRRLSRGRHAMIRKLPSGKYRLYSRKTDPKTGKRRNLGTFASRAAAEKHERAVQYFKRH